MSLKPLLHLRIPCEKGQRLKHLQIATGVKPGFQTLRKRPRPDFHKGDRDIDNHLPQYSIKHHSIQNRLERSSAANLTGSSGGNLPYIDDGGAIDSVQTRLYTGVVDSIIR